MYADDTTLIYIQPNTHNLQNNINTELDIVTKWFKWNRLLINPSKNFFTIFHKSNSTNSLDNFLIKINYVQLNKVKIVNFLGVFIDFNMQ